MATQGQKYLPGINKHNNVSDYVGMLSLLTNYCLVAQSWNRMNTKIGIRLGSVFRGRYISDMPNNGIKQS